MPGAGAPPCSVDEAAAHRRVLLRESDLSAGASLLPGASPAQSDLADAALLAPSPQQQARAAPLRQGLLDRGSVNDVAAAHADDPERAAAGAALLPRGGKQDLRWARALGRWLGARSSAGRRWRCSLEPGGYTAFRSHSNSNMLNRPAWGRWAVNAGVCFIVVFEALWWMFVVYSERRQSSTCIAGAVVDAVRGLLATVGCGAGALLVSSWAWWLHCVP